MNSQQRRDICQFTSSALGFYFLGLSEVFAKPPSPLSTPHPRIISVGGAITEILYELGLGDFLVAVDTSSNYPLQTKTLANIGYARTISMEGLLSISPTHIVGSEHMGPAHVVELLRKYQQVHFHQFFPAYSFAGLLTLVQQLAAIFDVVKRGERLQHRLKNEWQEILSSNHSKDKKTIPPKVLFILSHRSSEILAGGRETAADAMIHLAGGVNVANHFSSYRPLNKEALLQANPDFILTTTQSKKFLDAWIQDPLMAHVPAIFHRRIVSVEANQLLGFGPRLPQTVAHLRRSFVI
ncbi:MAG: hemin ABC transporter substrate-binding protein [Polynucleobacter sp.]|nr:MAG: hemin ABC transporter substrate-binding protein [Polynucleobacter sp.]